MLPFTIGATLPAAASIDSKGHGIGPARGRSVLRRRAGGGWIVCAAAWLVACAAPVESEKAAPPATLPGCDEIQEVRCYRSDGLISAAVASCPNGRASCLAGTARCEAPGAFPTCEWPALVKIAPASATSCNPECGRQRDGHGDLFWCSLGCSSDTYTEEPLVYCAGPSCNAAPRCGSGGVTCPSGFAPTCGHALIDANCP